MAGPVSPAEYGEGMTDAELETEGWATGLHVWGPVEKAYQDFVQDMTLANSQLWSLAQAIRAQALAPTIRVIERGDFEDQMRLRIIGPFATEDHRNAELARLGGLPLMNTLADLAACTIQPVDAEQAITPEVSAQVQDANELFEAFWQ